MKDILETIYNNYNKILLINCENDTFEEIKVSKNERVSYSGLNQWFIEFANSQIHPQDRNRFLEFANTISILKNIYNKKSISIIYEKREENNNYHWARMEILKTAKYGSFVLFVEDINDEVPLMEQQKYRHQHETRDAINDYLNTLQLYGVPVGIILVEHNPIDKIQIEQIFEYHRNKVFEYDDSHLVIILNGLSSENFYNKLANIYNELKQYSVNIGSAWREELEYNQELINSAIMNLSNNRKID